MHNDKFYGDFGLFRFSLIAPAINHTHCYKSNYEYFKVVSSKKHIFDGKEYSFSISCLKKWYYKYKKEGYQSLEKKKRIDSLSSRKLNNEAIDKIVLLREQFPHMNGSAI